MYAKYANDTLLSARQEREMSFFQAGMTETSTDIMDITKKLLTGIRY